MKTVVKRETKDSREREQWHICSDMVSIRWQQSENQERIESAVLEEIGPDGAVVQLESAMACRTTVRLDCSSVGFDGLVRECRYEEGLGYFAKIAFHSGQRWSPDVYRPQHLLDLGDSASQPSECVRGCGTLDWCPTEYVARAVDPQSKVDETVRRVAQNLAVVCGEMDTIELARCFVHHFGAPQECLLFTRFARAYRNARENLDDSYEQPVSPLRQACNIAMLLASVPDEAFRSQTCMNAGHHHC